MSWLLFPYTKWMLTEASSSTPWKIPPFVFRENQTGTTWVNDRILILIWNTILLHQDNNSVSTQNILTSNASLEESTAQTPYPALQSMFAGTSVALRMGGSCLGTLRSDLQKPPQRPLWANRGIAGNHRPLQMSIRTNQTRSTHQELQSTSYLQSTCHHQTV